ncbi:MAG: GNAT family N-acetyltransferase [Methanolinea sp.]
MEPAGRGGFDVLLVKEWDLDDLVRLYRAGSWWSGEGDPSVLSRIVGSSFAFAVAVHVPTGETAGMGRAISDGVSDAYIQDLLVLPEFRGRGVGRMIVEKLVSFCLSRGITWIGLVAAPGTTGFYARCGFLPMDDHVPMRYHGGGSPC